MICVPRTPGTSGPVALPLQEKRHRTCQQARYEADGRCCKASQCLSLTEGLPALI
jgi:hypothetical protein